MRFRVCLAVALALLAAAPTHSEEAFYGAAFGFGEVAQDQPSLLLDAVGHSPERADVAAAPTTTDTGADGPAWEALRKLSAQPQRLFAAPPLPRAAQNSGSVRPPKQEGPAWDALSASIGGLGRALDGAFNAAALSTSISQRSWLGASQSAELFTVAAADGMGEWNDNPCRKLDAAAFERWASARVFCRGDRCSGAQFGGCGLDGSVAARGECWSALPVVPIYNPLGSGTNVDAAIAGNFVMSWHAWSRELHGLEKPMAIVREKVAILGLERVAAARILIAKCAEKRQRDEL